jgi:hypothetical protein
MRPKRPTYNHAEGKTYSLFGNSDSTSGYYETIKRLADRSCEIMPDKRKLIDEIRKFSSGKRRLKKSLEKVECNDPGSVILNMIDPALKVYTGKAAEHLATLPLSKIWDRRLATSREQYHLYMLEIELTNRLNRDEFLSTDTKIALMPYCLQDFSADCKSERNGFDYQCRSCSGNCFQNHASAILKDNNIEPYIWMEGNMKHLAKYTLSQNKTFGVIGIACIPELTFGMRDCRNKKIPVVGLPLNANRCIRWFGEFFQNSIDLNELENVVASCSPLTSPHSSA